MCLGTAYNKCALHNMSTTLEFMTTIIIQVDHWSMQFHADGLKFLKETGGQPNKYDFLQVPTQMTTLHVFYFK